MSVWNNLVNSALLGTEKMPLQEHLLPASIREKLKNANQNDREGLFLQASALLWAYNRAGKEAEELTLIEIENAPDETLETCPPEAQSIFKKLLENENTKTALLDLFLDKLIVNQWIISPNLLRSLLDEGTRNKNKTLRNKIKQVTGERGHWLVQFNESWQYLQPVDLQQLWLEGKNAERYEALTEARKTNPGQALAMLKAVWENESARERKAFLEILEVNLSNQDEVFIQSVYEDVLKQKDNDKGLKAEIKSKCVELLLGIEESALSQEILDKIEAYFTKKKKLISFGKKFDIALNLPKKPDGFLNVEQMNGQLGFQKTSPQPDILTETEYWFSEILSNVPVHKWVDFFENSVADIIEFWAEQSGELKKSKGIFKTAIAHSIARFEDAESAKVFLKKHDDHTSKAYYLLQQEDFEEAILKHRNVAQENGTKELILNYSEQKWSINFTSKLLNQMLDGQTSYYNNNSFITQCFKFMPDQIASIAFNMNPKVGHEWQKQQWDTHVANPMLDWLEIRKAIEHL